MRACCSAARTIAWKASDPNGDALAFDLYYRGIAETDWKLLKDNITG